MMLQLIDVCKNYMQGSIEVPVLKQVNFSMEEGEYTAVMGPSGSGKSTMMNLIGCLDTPTSGSLYLDGQDMKTCSEDQLSEVRLRKLGFIFQSFQLLPYLSAVENVALPAGYAGVAKKKRLAMAAEMLEKVGLGDRLGFKPTQLSGGQKQRVAIARAMINRPKLLLADEPTGALDSASGKQIMELFEELNREGISILMITHDALVADRAHRIVRISDGELFEESETKA